jgi:hypothetical protein
MRMSSLCVAATLLACSAAAEATVFTFQGDPFAGTDFLNQPGGQIRQGLDVERLIEFNPETDVFALDRGSFGVNSITFANDVQGNLPGNVNIVVLETFDNDGNPNTGFNAGIAADLIAEQVTESGAGFFVYFNSGLNLPRLVFSTDLSDPNADLSVLARLTNFTGEREELQFLTAANFALVPEPTGLLLVATASGAWLLSRARRRATGPAALG